MPPAAPSVELPAPRPRLGRTVVALSVVSLLTDLSSEMIYPLLPLFLVGTLGASAGMLGAIEGAAETTAALLKLASGWWSDRLRRRKPLVVAGYALAAAARPLVALATTAGQVLAIRVTDRVGKGVRGAPRDALLADAVPPALRGRAFGLHRAADHLGAVLGPLAAFVLLEHAGVPLRTVFLWAAVPGAAAVVVLWLGVRERPRAIAAAPVPTGPAPLRGARLGRPFWWYLGAVLLFTLGNASDAFLLLRAAQLGVPASAVPLLWALLHVVKSLSSAVGGSLSDRVGRRPLIAGGWLVYAAVYLLFARATDAWHAWALFTAYGVHFGMTEGAEKALVADLAPADRRGSAFGWYNLAVGVGALPASVVFGVVWQTASPGAAFALGAALALAAATVLLVARPGQQQREPAPLARSS